jgi:hypothetical protein
MANTFDLISSIVLTSDTAFGSVSFTSIPATYTDFRVMVSARSNRNAADGLERVYLYFNGSSSNILMINWTGNSGTSDYSYYDTAGGVGGTVGLCSNQNAPANQYGFSDLYINEYTSTTKKIGIACSVIPIGAGGTLNYNFTQSYSHGTTSPISSITTSGLGSNWLSGSTFYLYGIKKL